MTDKRLRELERRYWRLNTYESLDVLDQVYRRATGTGHSEALQVKLKARRKMALMSCLQRALPLSVPCCGRSALPTAQFSVFVEGDERGALPEDGLPWVEVLYACPSERKEECVEAGRVLVGVEVGIEGGERGEEWREREREDRDWVYEVEACAWDYVRHEVDRAYDHHQTGGRGGRGRGGRFLLSTELGELMWEVWDNKEAARRHDERDTEEGWEDYLRWEEFESSTPEF